MIELKDDEFFIKTALLLAKKSSCVSKQVGAVLVKDGRSISMGYNGSHSKNINCCEVFDRKTLDFDKHHEWSRTYEVHAEMNCLMFASKNGISTNNCTMYVTLSPCQECLKTLLQAGINRIVYLVDYQRNIIPEHILSYMQANNIEFIKYKPINIFLTKSDIKNHYSYRTHAFKEILEDSIKYYTNHIPDKHIHLDREIHQRFLHIEKDILEVPMCKYTGDICDFTKQGYSGLSIRAKTLETRLNLAKYAKWITLDFLCSGIEFDKIEYLMKDTGSKNMLFKFRQSFRSNIFNSLYIRETLIENGFNNVISEEKANTIHNGKTLLDFIDWFNYSTSFHNTDKDYWIHRGWDRETADNRMKEFYIKGMNSINAKRLLCPVYDSKFRDSRLNGLKSNRNKSKLQLSIIESFKQNNLTVKEDISIKLNTANFPNKRFLIDCEINNCLIEINGSYWHNDIFINFTSFSDYVREIIKAQDIINSTGKKYFIIWEYDLKTLSIENIADMIKNLDPNRRFFSTRYFDEQLFNENLETI